MLLTNRISTSHCVPGLTGSQHLTFREIKKYNKMVGLRGKEKGYNLKILWWENIFLYIHCFQVLEKLFIISVYFCIASSVSKKKKGFFVLFSFLSFLRVLKIAFVF